MRQSIPRGTQKRAAPLWGPRVFCLSPVCWRRATLAFRLPSPQEGLTAVFGMRTGVPPPTKHQHTILKNLFCSIKTEERHKSTRKVILRIALRRPQDKTRLPQFLARTFMIQVGSKLPSRTNPILMTRKSCEFCRGISTPRLSALLHVHLAPINVVISHDPITIPYLGVSFPLRCFQRLSVPDIATGQCTWWYSPQTSGRSVSVLSY